MIGACANCGCRLCDAPEYPRGSGKPDPAWLCLECAGTKAGYAWRDDDSEPGDDGS